jgi:hypothetical protein
VKRITLGTAAAACLFVATGAGAVEIGGTLITEYRDRTGQNQNGAGSTPSIAVGTTHGQFRMVQTNLRLTHDLSEMNHFGAAITTGGGALALSEAWLQAEGLPYDGSITVGRFYKPLGAPLQTVGLSYPALLFHTAPVLGIKTSMEYYPFRWEVGMANNNPFSATGSVISNSAAFGRPLAAINTNNKEVYGFLGWRDGGEWGALDVNIGYTYGEMSATDRAVLQGLTTLPFGAGPRIFERAIGAQESHRDLLDVAVDYTYGPWRVNGEYAVANEGILKLTTYNLTGSYRTGDFNWVVGYDRLKNNATNRVLNVPASWGRERWSYSVAWEYRPQLTFQLEYEQNAEDLTSVAAGTTSGLRRRAVENDAVILQCVASF